MKINGDECELITDFAQLRPTDLIYLVHCDRCGKPPHRAMLIRGIFGPVQMPNNIIFMLPGFPMYPEPHSGLRPGQMTMVTPPDVAARAIWRVIIPPKTEDEPTTTEDNDDAVRQSQAEPVHACGAPARRA